MMFSRRRAIAVSLSLLLIHLAWAGSGSACDMAAGDDAGVGTSTAMDMSGDMAGMGMPAPTGTQSGGDHHHAPCDVPWAPDACQSMAACASLAMVPTAGTERMLHAVPSMIASVLVLAPPSITLTPELPPPRA